MASLGYYEIILMLICFLMLYFLGFLGTIDVYPLNLPLIGGLPRILLNIHNLHDWSSDLFARVGSTFLLKGPYFVNMDMMVTADPANVQYILTANFSNFHKGRRFLKIFEILGDGIFNSDGELWQKQRKFAQLYLGHRRFHQFLIKTCHEKVEKGLIPILEHVCKQGIVVDLQDLFQRFAFDATCILVTGYDPGSLSIKLPYVALSKAMEDAEKAILIRHMVPECFWKLQRWLGIGQEKKMSNAWVTIDNIIDKFISKKREELSEGTNSKEKKEGIDLLTSYLIENETMGLMFNEKFLRDTTLTFMAAGSHTISSAITWFLWLISTNPNVEAKIREELEATVPEKEVGKWRLFDAEEVSKLVYVHCALCESLRLYPPIPFEHREPLRPDVLPSGHRVHPGMIIVYSIYAMGRMKFIWGDDCLEFKPERWISEQGSIKYEPSYKFTVFNSGPRTCLGKEMSFTQMKVAVASVIYNYNIRVVEGHVVAPDASMILHMKDGLMVRITNRWCLSSGIKNPI